MTLCVGAGSDILKGYSYRDLAACGRTGFHGGRARCFPTDFAKGRPLSTDSSIPPDDPIDPPPEEGSGDGNGGAGGRLIKLSIEDELKGSYLTYAMSVIVSRALVVYYQGTLSFPTYGSMIPGSRFGLGYEYETNYRELQKRCQQAGNRDFVLMPPVPFNPYENDLKDGSYPPFAPSFKERHFLGTDNVGRDVLARLVYGFRTAILFSGILLIFNYSVGIVLGCAMGYFGGRFDLFFQRILEIWSNIPFLYVVIIVSSIMLLLLIMAFFGWIQITWVMLQQGWTNMEAWWISSSVVAALVITLMAVTFTGEGIREAFDPKLHTVYE